LEKREGGKEKELLQCITSRCRQRRRAWGEKQTKVGNCGLGKDQARMVKRREWCPSWLFWGKSRTRERKYQKTKSIYSGGLGETCSIKCEWKNLHRKKKEREETEEQRKRINLSELPHQKTIAQTGTVSN